MDNPVLVEVVRSRFVESVHHGALVILGPDGSPLLELGEVRSPVYPRSANKPLQGLGMLRAGLDLDEADLALGCASHNGEPEHVRRALALLERHGLGEEALACPPDRPLYQPCAATGSRRAAMNCSGKHAAMLATCVQADRPTEGYGHPEHKLQRTIAETVVEATGEPIAATGVDGCGAPLFAFSLTGLARAYQGLVTAAGDQRRIADAMRAHPWLVAGTGREDTLLMLAVPGLLAKGGAEGVHAMALPDGTAIALKIDDGATRARNPLLVAALRELGALPDNPAARSVLDGLAAGEVRGGGRRVGELRVREGVLRTGRGPAS
ncbi:asparaginase [Amycolatopsis cihanbeyliensis]|uniref:Asparaginase n=1 Tax=Amycolatopsis cihanbeyliensis TaxID=1128664 RepID=A0A542DKG9_AMYCI|nr:asparaginase [Amycolatopsis cihanbeyliensis]TQJ03534.1 asparaginase [Amycolatopsis cihanbeyliensis]